MMLPRVNASSELKQWRSVLFLGVQSGYQSYLASCRKSVNVQIVYFYFDEHDFKVLEVYKEVNMQIFTF